MASSSATLAGSAAASDLLRSSTGGFTGVPLRSLGSAGLVLKRRELTVSVTARLKKGRKKKEYPWPSNPDPNVKGGVLTHLSPFKPLKEKPTPVTLDFEKPLVDLQKKIIEVRKMANETGLDFSDQILLLETKYQQALMDLYTHLTPYQRLTIARHPNRPTCLDHIFNITEKFMELHGDREGYDDPAIVTGIGNIDGRTYMFIGHQKGRNTKENIKRNFGMPTPHGYRKALRLMQYADHHGFPIITFIDTPGAYADLKSEELNQGEAIAYNLRTMFGLKVPVISIVIGEGGSGGALAIGCGNKLLMLENAVFYVASPEACAAILWKSSKAAPKVYILYTRLVIIIFQFIMYIQLFILSLQAAEKLKITAHELCKLQVADGVIPEPIGGAHTDPSWTSQQIKIAINEAMDELTKLNTQDLLKDRYHKFRKLGGFQEGIPIDPKKGFNMRKRDIPVPPKISDSELEIEIEKLKQQISESPSAPPKFDLHKTIKKLEREVDQEFSEAVKALGLTERFSKLRDEVSKATSENQTIDPLLQDKIEKLNADFNQRLSAAPNSNKLQKKRDMLRELTEVKLLLDRNKETARLKQKLKKKFDDVINNPTIKENYEALQSEIQRVGASSASDLDDELKKKIAEFNKEVDLQLANAVKSVGLDDQFINGSQSSVPEIEELNKEVEKEIEILANTSTDFKRMIEELKVEVAKAGGTPDLESKNRIDDLTQKIKQSLAEATGSSSLKYENLVSKISGNGSFKAGESLTDDELREKIGANLNFS
ncbi:acetyl-coenzyme A carboxylase carboxyl transferase subunit alpha, chloroplastic isoform X1 [Trifolium pratense]|uniref:acetyl-coenzyme A carboxylase carboxyl transferase subunit alpha, chloroplastic isoform X1 n=1 Tax=Trifolium pratense TaxID=57577 RepID=UPI001E696A36|nr:acetyl-coenzyme A carboxylase carboxyl transferase subunit alpha, chloroplastic isoform X1 [Trifolium pratense]